MCDIKGRLKDARIKAGFPSAAAFARRYGIAVSTYAGYENGDRAPGVLVLERLASLLNVSESWLITGTPAAPLPSRGFLTAETMVAALTVMGRIGAGAEIDAGVEQPPLDGYFSLESMIPLPPGAIGLEVSGDSMWPRYDPGDIVVCQAEGTPLSKIADGSEAAVRLDDGRRYLKCLYKTPVPGVFNLISHNAPPIHGVQVMWAAKVVAVIRAGMYRELTHNERGLLPNGTSDWR